MQLETPLQFHTEVKITLKHQNQNFHFLAERKWDLVLFLVIDRNCFDMSKKKLGHFGQNV